MNSKNLPASVQKVQQFVRSHLIPTMTVTIAGSLLLTGVSAANIWNVYQGFRLTVERQFEMDKRSGEIRYLDEVLTMSARMAATTGDSQWEKRYNEFVPKLDAAIKFTLDNSNDAIRAQAQQTDQANSQLIKLESDAFALARKGQLKDAQSVLFGPQYLQQKSIYAAGNDLVLAQVEQLIKRQLQGYQQQLLISIGFAIGILPILLGIWTLVLSAVRGYISDQENSRQSIQEFQDSLLKVNEQLQAEGQLRTAQQTQVVQESELLQTDIGHILDVVCSLEEGDLTAQAEVNERATGLVSDTLNRLTESLNNIITVVVSSAHQVTDGAAGLDRLALETANQAQNQTQSIQQVESLIAQVNQLTINSSQQAIATTSAVQLAKTAVSSGQEEMSAMVGGIDSLQQGTEQIVKRMQILNDFVELATQFSKDQKRVAALTRVLALNASLLSSRAVKEQDPEQFASIASEFETIATQVNELASDTNRSLVTLQQRTNQIQTVTTGLDQDVIEINQLVQKFTNEVGKSRQAFHNIQAVTDQVATMGEQVNASSQEIVAVVRDTLSAIQSIGIIAQNTENQATVTREEVQTMAELAQNLLQRVEFFQLNKATPATSTSGGFPADSTAALSSFTFPEDSTAVPKSTLMLYQPLESPAL